MFGWFSQFFPGLSSYALNPALLGGAILIAAPIIIHLLNRLRYRKVEFAAMEFLLESQKQNQSRIMLEQLLLLLLRILIILAIVALLARLFLSSTNLSMFQGAQSHHLVLLDNSGSMKQTSGDVSAYDNALKVIKKLITEGTEQPGSQKLSLILLSEPADRFFYSRDINEELLNDFVDKMPTLKKKGLNKRLSFNEGIQEARKLLDEDQTAIKHLHILSDFRDSDWLQQAEPASTIKQLTESKISVELVRTIVNQTENLAITNLQTEKSTSTKIPIQLNATIKNHGLKEAKDIPVTIKLDGVKIPGAATIIKSVKPGEEIVINPEVEFDTVGYHQISIHLPDDSLLQDNERFAAVAVTEFDQILLIDGTPGQSESSYANLALAPNLRQKVSGFSTRKVGVDYLSKSPLEPYSMIYLINVPTLSESAQASLRSYVEDGGGLAWFMGDAVSPAFYNNNLYNAEEIGLFPVLLGSAPQKLEENSESVSDLAKLEETAYFNFLNQDGGFMKRYLNIFQSYPVDKDWVKNDVERNDRIKTVGSLRNGKPIYLKHSLGKGTIFTSLTSIGPMGSQGSSPEEDTRWNNWTFGVNSATFVVFLQELTKETMRTKEDLSRRFVSDEIDLEVDPAEFSKEIQVVDPANRVVTLTASNSGNPASQNLQAKYTQTDTPGVYRARYFSEGDIAQEQLFAYNVPEQESILSLAEPKALREKIDGGDNIAIQDATGALRWLDGQQSGQDLTRMLLIALFILLVVEQFLGYRLSFHSRRQEALA